MRLDPMSPCGPAGTPLRLAGLGRQHRIRVRLIHASVSGPPWTVPLPSPTREITAGAVDRGCLTRVRDVARVLRRHSQHEPRSARTPAGVPRQAPRTTRRRASTSDPQPQLRPKVHDCHRQRSPVVHDRSTLTSPYVIPDGFVKTSCCHGLVISIILINTSINACDWTTRLEERPMVIRSPSRYVVDLWT